MHYCSSGSALAAIMRAFSMLDFNFKSNSILQHRMGIQKLWKFWANIEFNILYHQFLTFNLNLLNQLINCTFCDWYFCQQFYVYRNWPGHTVSLTLEIPKICCWPYCSNELGINQQNFTPPGTQIAMHLESIHFHKFRICNIKSSNLAVMLFLQ